MVEEEKINRWLKKIQGKKQKRKYWKEEKEEIENNKIPIH